VGVDRRHAHRNRFISKPRAGSWLPFAERTGLGSQQVSTRYLWTDALAVCSFLSLAVQECAFNLLPGGRWQVEMPSSR
jgi:hypothetical protein